MWDFGTFYGLYLAFCRDGGKVYGLRCKVARIENKWLVCIDMGACGMGIYPGRFTFERSDRLLDMPPSVPSTCHLDFLTSNELRSGFGIYDVGVCFPLEYLSTYIYPYSI